MAFVSPAIRVDHHLGVINKISRCLPALLLKTSFWSWERPRASWVWQDVGFQADGRTQTLDCSPSLLLSSLRPWRGPPFLSQPVSPSVKWESWPRSVFPKIQSFVKEPPLLFFCRIPYLYFIFTQHLPLPPPPTVGLAIDSLLKQNVFEKETLCLSLS